MFKGMPTSLLVEIKRKSTWMSKVMPTSTLVETKISLTSLGSLSIISAIPILSKIGRSTITMLRLSRRKKSMISDYNPASRRQKSLKRISKTISISIAKGQKW